MGTRTSEWLWADNPTAHDGQNATRSVGLSSGRPDDYTRFMARYALALVSFCLLPPAAFAQEDRGAIVGASAAATNMEEHTDFAFAGTFGYRFSRVFGMEIEATAVPDLRTSFYDGLPVILSSSSVTSVGGTLPFTIYPGPTYANQRGRNGNRKKASQRLVPRREETADRHRDQREKETP